jgi:hypothetical protein
MSQFKLQAGTFNQLRKKMILRVMPIIVIMLVFVVVMNQLNPAYKDSDINVLPIVIPFMLMAMGAGIFISISRQKKMYESYCLTISESMISRDQLFTPMIGISPLEVSQITLNPDNGFTIKGRTTRDIIIVPAQIENYTEVKRLLEEIMPLTTVTKKSFIQKYQLLISIFMIVVMATVYISSNKMLVALCGTAVIAVLVYSFFEGIKNKNIDNRTRIMLWFVWLVIFSIAGTMFWKLTGIFAPH